MNTKLKWGKSDEGFVETHDGLYTIEPWFNHATRPQGYHVYFNPELKDNSLPRERIGHGYTLTDAKRDAERHHNKHTEDWSVGKTGFVSYGYKWSAEHPDKGAHYFDTKAEAVAYANSH